MLIRSQDKTKLVKINEINFSELDNKESKPEYKIYILPESRLGPEDCRIQAVGDKGRETLYKIQRPVYEKKYVFNNDLGIYYTKEKAMKVVDMLQKAWSKEKHKYNYTIFQMPQDNDVK